MSNQEKICCPPFDPAPWHEKAIAWEEKRFVKDRVLTFFFIPLTFGRTITRMMSRLEAVNASCPDWLCLSDHTSKWNMDLYLAVDKEIPGAENLALSGTFLSKVYEGNYNQTGAWCEDFKDYARSQGKTISKWYMWYTTCPKCAKKYGKNYVVILGRV